MGLLPPDDPRRLVVAVQVHAADPPVDAVEGDLVIWSIRPKHAVSPRYGRVSRAAARTKAVPDRDRQRALAQCPRAAMPLAQAAGLALRPGPAHQRRAVTVPDACALRRPH
jgi:hypothetical protein